MPSTYVLARDHLLRAVAVLQGTDSRSRQLRQIVERTISLIDDMPPAVSPTADILDLAAFRERRTAID